MELGITIRGRALFDKIRLGVFNATSGMYPSNKIGAGVKLSGCAISSRDTEFTYAISCDGKLSKAQLSFVRTLAQGIAIGAELDSAITIL